MREELAHVTLGHAFGGVAAIENRRYIEAVDVDRLAAPAGVDPDDAARMHLRILRGLGCVAFVRDLQHRAELVNVAVSVVSVVVPAMNERDHEEVGVVVLLVVEFAS